MQNLAIEIHDSMLDQIAIQNGEALLYFPQVYIRSSEGRPAIDAGTGWTQQALIRIENAHIDGKLSDESIYWFSRAVRLGDTESNLDIGKHFLHNENNPRKAIVYFKRVRPTRWVSQAGVEEAAKLLQEAKRRLKAR